MFFGGVWQSLFSSLHCFSMVCSVGPPRTKVSTASSRKTFSAEQELRGLRRSGGATSPRALHLQSLIPPIVRKLPAEPHLTLNRRGLTVHAAI